MDMDVDPPLRTSTFSAALEELLPSELNPSAQGHGLDVSKDRLSVRYISEGRHPNDVGAIQANRPIPSHRLVYYFEMSILDQGERDRVTIGFSDKSFKLTRQPGWEPNSWGYHGNDGCKFCVQGEGKGEEYGPKFGTGDTVGAGIHLGRQELFFTRNGVKLKVAFRNVRGVLYPTVGLHSKNESVKLNFGQQPFLFDLEGMVNEERAAQLAVIEKIEISPVVTHCVVRQYLLHFGYADTLRAFDEAAGPAGSSHGCAAVDALDASVRDGGSATSSSTSSIIARSNEAETASLLVRQAVRKCILAGDVDGALLILQERCPLLLQSPAGWRDVLFPLHCQKYIELLRRHRVMEALSFAQEVLFTYTSPASRQTVTPLEATLQEVVALIAYQDPAQSPLGPLLSTVQREAVADSVNAAMLVNASGHGPQHRPLCVVDQIVKQVVVLHDVLHEQNGGQGEPFKLSHLLPPAPRGV